MTYLISNKLNKYLNDEKCIRKHYGNLSDAITFSISVLVGADCLALVPNVPPTRRHKLSDGNWALDLNKNWRMIIRPLDGDSPENIKSIEIIDIVDYH